jgi:hypothetical protein
MAGQHPDASRNTLSRRRMMISTGEIGAVALLTAVTGLLLQAGPVLLVALVTVSILLSAALLPHPHRPFRAYRERQLHIEMPLGDSKRLDRTLGRLRTRRLPVAGMDYHCDFARDRESVTLHVLVPILDHPTAAPRRPARIDATCQHA